MAGQDQDHSQFTSRVLDAGPLGHIEGSTLSTGEGDPVLTYFGGLPYALPPVGPYRFRRPRPLPGHFRYGTKVSPGRFTHGAGVCPQPKSDGKGGQRAGPLEEDCLQLNIYVPTGTPPSPHGWPVLFNIHGGFLQWGDANYPLNGIASLFGDTTFKAVIVMPAYRLNIFGFLASRELDLEARAHGETVGNMGFWDQRLALEWTYQNIKHFSGDASNITVAGYSAGAHSTFHQLAHELYHVHDDDAIIKRVIMWSNSPGLQPKTLAEHQQQFDEVLLLLNIPSSLSATEKLSRLRDTHPQQLMEIQDHLKLSQFRAFSDGAFVSKSLIADINSGDFGRRMKARRIKLMNGECRDEHDLYRSWRTPQDSFASLYARLCADYPERAVAKLCREYCGSFPPTLPPGFRNWQYLFGHLYANLQVHSLERGFYNALHRSGLRFGQDVLRYRFDWQTRASKEHFPDDWGVTHSTDLAIWFWGHYTGGLTDEEKLALRNWNENFAAFVRGDAVAWGTSDVKEVRRLNARGETDIWIDDQWDEGIRVWNLLNGEPGAGLWTRIKSRL